MDYSSNSHYEHLGNTTAKVTVQAALALALAAGYDSGEMFTSNNRMTINDISMDDEGKKAVVKNFSLNSTVPWITISGKLYDYLKRYFDIRKSHYSNDEFFLVKMWSGRQLNIVDTNDKPDSIQTLVLYMLKHLSKRLELEYPLQITHLRSNMVLHSLYNSRGSDLPKIIEVFGYPKFVQNSFEKFCEEMNNYSYYGFDPFAGEDFTETSEDSSDFFQTGSPEASGEPNEEEIIQIRQRLIDERVRNTTRAKKLKKMYNYTCQICGISLTLVEGIKYSEVNHIQPHGKEHNGADDFHNMIVLCPNHHTLFDLGLITIDPLNLIRILHVDKNNELHYTKLKVIKHEFSSTCVRYHYEHVFMPIAHKLGFS